MKRGDRRPVRRATARLDPYTVQNTTWSREDLLRIRSEHPPVFIVVEHEQQAA